MNKQTKGQKTNQDTISKIKKDGEKKKTEDLPQNEEDYQGDSEEETQKATGVVQEQVVQKNDKPKGLKDLNFSNNTNKEVKAQPKQQKKQQPQQQNQGEPRPKFINTKGTANAAEVDTTSVSHNFESQQVKKQYNAGAKALLANTAEQNKNIKAPMNYTNKETKKQYKDDKEENIAKPEFKNLKVGDQENFIEIKQNEDLFYLKSKDAPESKLEYSEAKNPHPKKQKPYYKEKDDEPKVELDSDGFEIVGSKPEKKSTGPKQHYNKPYHHHQGGKYKKNYKKKDGDHAKKPQAEGEVKNEEGTEENKGEEKKEGEHQTTTTPTPAAAPKENRAPQAEPVTISMKAGGKLGDLFSK